MMTPTKKLRNLALPEALELAAGAAKLPVTSSPMMTLPHPDVTAACFALASFCRYMTGGDLNAGCTVAGPTPAELWVESAQDRKPLVSLRQLAEPFLPVFKDAGEGRTTATSAAATVAQRLEDLVDAGLARRDTPVTLACLYAVCLAIVARATGLEKAG